MYVRIGNLPEIRKWLEMGEMDLAEIEVSFSLLIDQSLAIVERHIATDESGQALLASKLTKDLFKVLFRHHYEKFVSHDKLHLLMRLSG